MDKFIKDLAKKILNEVQFADTFPYTKQDRKLTTEEIIRSIREMIASEHEAVHMYTQLVETTDNKLVQKVVQDIADEEKVHIGEFMKLLFALDPKEKDYYEKGFEEVKKIEI